MLSLSSTAAKRSETKWPRNSKANLKNWHRTSILRCSRPPTLLIPHPVFHLLTNTRPRQFLITKLIRYCPTHRDAILVEFHGHVLRLLLHKEATRVVADAYELYTNAAQRALLVRDFYGKEVALFEPKINGPSGLKDVLKGAERERCKRILGALKENLATMYALELSAREPGTDGWIHLS
jgi:hypothetical protein